MANNSLIAGAGKAAIQLSGSLFPWESFKRVHDQLHARAIYLEQGEKVLLVSVELTSLPDEEVEALKNEILENYKFKRENIWICVTHTFSAPHLLPVHMLKTEELRIKRDRIRQAVRDAVLESVNTAVKTREPATMGIRLGCCQVNVNRDIETPDGWWIGKNEFGPSDKALHVIRIDSTGEKRQIAALYHYAVQSSITDFAVDCDGMKYITSDLVGYASNYMESGFDIPVAFYLMGAAGDQAPFEKADDSVSMKKAFSFVRELGELLGKAVVITNRKIVTTAAADIRTLSETIVCPAQKMAPDLHSLKPCRTYRYEADGEKETTVYLIQCGDIALIGVQPELSCYTALELKSGSKFRYTLPVTMVNGSAKYMADCEAYEKNTYEAINSPFGKGSAEFLCRKTEKMLETLTME